MFLYQCQGKETRLQDLSLSDEIKNHIAKSMKRKTHRCSIKNVIKAMHKGKVVLNGNYKNDFYKSITPILMSGDYAPFPYGYLYLVIIDGISLKIGMTGSTTPKERIIAAMKGLCKRFNHSPNRKVTHVYVKPMMGLDRDHSQSRDIIAQESNIKHELAKVCKTYRRKRAPHYPEDYKTKVVEWMTDAKTKDVEKIAVDNGFIDITSMYTN